MLTGAQRSEFESRGVLRLRAAFSAEEAARMEDRVWSALGRRFGVERDVPATWTLLLGTGLQSLRSHHVFDPIGGPATSGALDDLLGPDRWVRPKHWGQFLVTFPAKERAAWTVPPRLWHTDFPYHLTPEPLPGILLFSILNRVPPDHGATLVVAGSHRVVRRFVETHPKMAGVKMKVARQALLASDPWLRALVAEDDAPDRVARFMESEGRIGDAPVRVVELGGEPGDVLLCHPWILHTGSVNCGDAPRFMRVQRLRRRGLDLPSEDDAFRDPA